MLKNAKKALILTIEDDLLHLSLLPKKDVIFLFGSYREYYAYTKTLQDELDFLQKETVNK